jgi:6-phosphogluconate dehydrogenase
VKIGMIGLGRMGSNMVRRLAKCGHTCVVLDNKPASAQALADVGAVAATSPADMLAKLPSPRIVWVMIPAGAVDSLLAKLEPGLHAGDIVIDGGNSNWQDDIRRAKQLKPKGVHYLDAGTSGGVFGLERGYCLMFGGEDEAVRQLEPIFAALASDGKTGGKTAERGYLHVGPVGAGHFVKMVHNGIEYGLMQAFAEGFNILHKIGADSGDKVVDAETAPTREQTHGFDFKLDEIAELWRHGSVVSSWLLDLLAGQLSSNATLDGFAGRVADSGEGRWTVEAAIEVGVPVPVLAASLFARFSSRGEADFSNRVLSAMRLGFGGHHEKAATSGG